MPVPGPPPDVAPLPASKPPRLEKLLHADDAITTTKRANEEKVLIAANQISKEHEVTMNDRHYKFSIPEDWKIYDGSYTPTADTGPLPGTVEKQFVAPLHIGIGLVFCYRGRPLQEQSGKIFQSALTQTPRASTLTGAQIQKLTPILDPLEQQNKYALGEEHKHLLFPFAMVDCRVITIAKNTPALLVEGEYRNEPVRDADKKADIYCQEVFLDGGMDGRQIHQIRLFASSKDMLEKHKAYFAEFLNKLSW